LTVARAKAMRTIVVAATKGGVGKTTLAAALAVRASAESALVALIDIDPQHSLARWWELRGEPKNPRLVIGVSRIDEAISLLQQAGWEWVFIDTPPAMLTLIEPTIRVAELVLIPFRASALDLEAAGPLIEMCRMHSRPYRFVINAAEPRSKLTKSAMSYLMKDGRVLPELISYRTEYIAPMTDGRSGPEVDGKCKEEIEALWQAVKKAAIKKKE